MINISPKSFIAPILSTLAVLFFISALLFTIFIALGVMNISWGLPIFLAIIGIVFLISSYSVAYFAARAFIRDMDSSMVSTFSSLNRRNG